MTQAEIHAMLDKQFAEMDAKVLEEFKLVLVEALKLQRAKVRASGGYNDDTGQLRSSVGGIIYKDGKVLYDDFELAPYGTDKAPGLRIGRDRALSELRGTKGWGITIVAGMEYASWVEKNHGLSVLVDAESELEKTLEQAFNNVSV